MRAVKENAYAKINLYLNVTGRRPDGFHDIETVMHTVTLCDEVAITLKNTGKRGVTLLLDGNRKIPSDSKNIAYLAAMAYLDRACIDAEVEIKLNKRIPVAAGLAGGSSDAAAVLRGINRLFDRPLTQKVLLSIAEQIGSDVPYCLLGGTAFCRGRGELIERLNNVRGYFVVAVADEHVSTPLAYGRLDELYSNFDGTVEIAGADGLSSLIVGVNRGEIRNKALFNIFEGAVLPACPGAQSIRDRLTGLGAEAAMMSGSGPSVFGIFSDVQGAERAADALCREGYIAFSVRSV